ncbi:unnamed protein product, partial [Rotaria sordida]
RRTMESVAAERLNKLGKNPSIISTQHNLKGDAAGLKDMIDRVTRQPSSDEYSDEDQDKNQDCQISSSSSSSSNTNKRIDLNSSFISLHKQFHKSNDQLEYLNKRIKRKSLSEEKKT